MIWRARHTTSSPLARIRCLASDSRDIRKRIIAAGDAYQPGNGGTAAISPLKMKCNRIMKNVA